MKKVGNNKGYALAIVFGAVIFLVLSLLHYFSQRPLWLDEDFIYRNIQSHAFMDIFGRLDNAQAFPRIYLFIIKFFSQFFHNHLLSLRFFPLIFMLSALCVWIKLYQMSLKDKELVLLATMSFICSYYMSYFAAELKPYSMDVLVVSLFALFINYQKGFQDQPPTKRLFVYSGLLPFLIFFSYAGIFVFWIVSYNYLRLLQNNKRLLWSAILNFSLTLACFATLYFIDLRYSLSETALYDYWKNYFVGTESFIAFITPFGEGLRKMITWWFGNTRIYVRAATPFILFFMYALYQYGFAALKKDGFKIFSVGSLFAVMFLELLILSMAHKYPFIGERVTLFLAPFVFYMIVKGINGLKKIRFLYYGFIFYYAGYLATCLINTFNHHLSLFKSL